jgi:hypothetical protein
MALEKDDWTSLDEVAFAEFAQCKDTESFGGSGVLDFDIRQDWEQWRLW